MALRLASGAILSALTGRLFRHVMQRPTGGNNHLTMMREAKRTDCAPAPTCYRSLRLP